MLESQGLDPVRLPRIRWEGAAVSQHLQDSLHGESSEGEDTSPWVGIAGKCSFFLNADSFGSLLVLRVFKSPCYDLVSESLVPLASA